MAIFVYVTDRCMDQARTHGFGDDVIRFAARVEDAQTTSMFDPFPPPYLVKKKLGSRQGRLIADLRTVGDHAVIVFLGVLIRGDREYEVEFVRDPHGYGQQHFNGLVTETDLQEFLEERTRTSPPTPKPEPSASEYEYLYSALTAHADSVPDDLICETKEWVVQVAQERIARQLVLLYRPCLDALSREPGLHFVPVSGKPGWGIWAWRTPSQLVLLLPATDTNADEIEAQARQMAAAFEGSDATAILRASRRAYPALILAEDELWIDLEKEPIANIALSPEESEVLESARRTENPFPLFINGRAGSGKSTILQYLFADLLYYHLTRPTLDDMAPPMYLTANGELLRIARTFVERILRSEAKYALGGQSDLVDSKLAVINGAFFQFHPFVLSLARLGDDAKRFTSGTRITYANFRQLWKEKFGRDPRASSTFGPDLSWHVIRSYIKGMSSETYLDPDDYAQLPENQLTVTTEAFKHVYERVWEGWYQDLLEKRGDWDDQDLTRFVLERDLVRPLYPAVFCDEAQDFTRLDLELLLRLNLYSNRSLPPNDISRVQFAFAGDQFQTLNPTGFRWDAIKASFVEKFIFELDLAHRSGRTDLNYKELEYNYRSTQSIVRFGNHVQAVRSALFDLPDVRPQRPWTTEIHTFPVEWFRAEDGDFWRKFRDNPGLVVIIPCEEDEEAEYVRRDPVLSAHVQFDDGVPVNVLSASRAKGCEFPSIVVYGFGAAAEKNLMTALHAEGTELAQKPDTSLPIQYFINRLYVAVSRAKQRLIIVDTQMGFNKLWTCALEEQALADLLARIRRGDQIWGGKVEGMIAGRAAGLTQDTVVNRLEIARSFESDGLARQDGFLLRQASQAYRGLGDMAKAQECRARALEAERNYLEAGEAFFDNGFTAEGLRCLWRAGSPGWEKLANQYADRPGLSQEIEFQWAHGAAVHVGPTAADRLLAALNDRLADANFAESCVTDPTWRSVIGAVVKADFTADHPQFSIDLWQSMAGSLDRLRNRGLRPPEAPIAMVYYGAQRFKEAVALWEQAGETRSREYGRAKAFSDPYPQNIASLTKIGLTAEVVAAYRAAKAVLLSPDQSQMVIDALRSSELQQEAFDLAWMMGLPGPMWALALDAWRKGDTHQISRAAVIAGIYGMVQHEQWESVSALTRDQRLQPTSEWNDPTMVQWLRPQMQDLQIACVRALARSRAFESAAVHHARPISEFLRNFLRIKGGRWRGHISIPEAGAAIEQTGRYADAVSFYEAVAQNTGFSEADRNFARLRWMLAQQRRAERELSQGSAQKAREIAGVLERAMKENGLTDLEHIDAVISLPALEKPLAVPAPSITPPAASVTVRKAEAEVLPELERSPSTADESLAAHEHVLVQVGAIKIELSRPIGRINLTHTATMETAFIKRGERRCGGEVTFENLGDGVWRCPSWDLTVRFLEETGTGLALELTSDGVEIRIAW